MNARDLEHWIRSACLLEATARKPGNVHPGASFADLTYDDFVKSANAIAPILAQARERGVGQAILDASLATREQVGRNTNLGIILLLAPLAAAEPGIKLRDGIAGVLAALGVEDSKLVYRAIAAAQPGGMGRVEDEDLANEPRSALVEVMRLAAGRDMIARQYATDFDLILNAGMSLLSPVAFRENWEQAVVRLYLELMSRHPDTLVARKCGAGVADESAERARRVLDYGWPDSAAGRETILELDSWLREDGNRRNPGTTADLVTACLFAAMREGIIDSPHLQRLS